MAGPPHPSRAAALRALVPLPALAAFSRSAARPARAPRVQEAARTPGEHAGLSPASPQESGRRARPGGVEVRAPSLDSAQTLRSLELGASRRVVPLSLAGSSSCCAPTSSRTPLHAPALAQARAQNSGGPTDGPRTQTGNWAAIAWKRGRGARGPGWLFRTRASSVQGPPSLWRGFPRPGFWAAAGASGVGDRAGLPTGPRCRVWGGSRPGARSLSLGVRLTVRLLRSALVRRIVVGPQTWENPVGGAAP